MKKHLLTTLYLFLVVVAYGQCPTGETEVTFELTLDRYGSETTWEITGQGGSPVYESGGPYSDEASNGAYPQPDVTFCVPDGTILEVTVNDDFGDGLCCAWGNGGWAISVGGTELASGGEFEDTDEATIVIGTDLGIAASGVPNIVIAGNVTISGTVQNFGTEVVSGFTLDYTIDNGTPVQQVFTTSVPVGGTAPFSFTTPWAATSGNYVLDLDLSGVSGDAIASNNSLTQNISVPTQIGTRLPLVEQFTSSTCGPCASLNDGAGFTDVLEGLNANSQTNAEIAVVKYQYDFPGQGDHAFNAEVDSRVFGFYFSGSIGIPEVFVDGDYITNPFGLNANGILAYQDEPAVIDISATHTITNGNEITVDVTVDPYADVDGKLYIYLLEKYYEATNDPSFSNGETEFYHIFRKMLPNANATSVSFTAGTQYTTQESYTANIVSGLPQQGSFDFRVGTELEVIAFVQAPNKAIYNAAVSTGSENLTGLRDYDDNTAIGVYPNPLTTGQLSVVVDSEGADDAILTITDLKGAVVFTEPLGDFISGVNRRTIDVNNLTSGIYNVNVMTSGHLHSTRIVVQK